MRKQADPDVRLLQAIADPTRLSIIRQLSSSGAVCACELSGPQGVSQPTVSHHLRVLREAGWIEGERRGTWIWYTIRPQAAARLAELAAQVRPGPARPATAVRRLREPLRVIQPA